MLKSFLGRKSSLTLSCITSYQMRAFYFRVIMVNVFFFFLELILFLVLQPTSFRISKLSNEFKIDKTHSCVKLVLILAIFVRLVLTFWKILNFWSFCFINLLIFSSKNSQHLNFPAFFTLPHLSYSEIGLSLVLHTFCVWYILFTYFISYIFSQYNFKFINLSLFVLQKNLTFHLFIYCYSNTLSIVFKFYLYLFSISFVFSHFCLVFRTQDTSIVPILSFYLLFHLPILNLI